MYLIYLISKLVGRGGGKETQWWNQRKKKRRVKSCFPSFILLTVLHPLCCNIGCVITLRFYLRFSIRCVVITWCVKPQDLNVWGNVGKQDICEGSLVINLAHNVFKIIYMLAACNDKLEKMFQTENTWNCKWPTFDVHCTLHYIVSVLNNKVISVRWAQLSLCWER